MTEYDKEVRLVDLINQMVPDLLSREDLERDGEVWIMRTTDTSFPDPVTLFVSLDGRPLPTDWFAIREFGVKHGAGDEIQYYRTDTERICRIWPATGGRADHLACTLIPKRNHPGARWTETLVRYVAPQKIDAIKLVDGTKIPVTIAPAYEVTA